MAGQVAGQLALDEQPEVLRPGALLRRDAGPTSTAAARSAALRSGKSRWRIMVAIADVPRTDDELQRDLLIGPNTQRPRRVELVNLGYIEDSGATRKTGSGHNAVVWRATAAGRRALAEVTQ